MKAQAHERAMNAWGVQCAIADLLSSKPKAMKAYLKAIGSEPEGPKTHSSEGARLGKRIQGLLKKGEL